MNESLANVISKGHKLRLPLHLLLKKRTRDRRLAKSGSGKLSSTIKIGYRRQTIRPAFLFRKIHGLPAIKEEPRGLIINTTNNKILL